MLLRLDFLGLLSSFAYHYTVIPGSLSKYISFVSRALVVCYFSEEGGGDLISFR